MPRLFARPCVESVMEARVRSKVEPISWKQTLAMSWCLYCLHPAVKQIEVSKARRLSTVTIKSSSSCGLYRTMALPTISRASMQYLMMDMHLDVSSSSLAFVLYQFNLSKIMNRVNFIWYRASGLDSSTFSTEPDAATASSVLSAQMRNDSIILPMYSCLSMRDSCVQSRKMERQSSMRSFTVLSSRSTLGRGRLAMVAQRVLMEWSWRKSWVEEREIWGRSLEFIGITKAWKLFEQSYERYPTGGNSCPARLLCFSDLRKPLLAMFGAAVIVRRWGKQGERTKTSKEKEYGTITDNRVAGLHGKGAADRETQ